MRRFNSILIANRGEIAVRVMRTAKSLGYRAIAVYSAADSDSLHVKIADAAVFIGPAPSTESYLSIERIIGAAKSCGADAIHPGYGFLSENSAFAIACEQAGIVFIGPTAEAIRNMGNKAQAKRLMIDAKVPCVPGYEGLDQSDDALIAAAESIGFPLMVKAAAGGGGRGMQLVNQQIDLKKSIQSARSVAMNSFGSDELILEKAIINPRHVEIQIFADTHGHVVHLGERDCSVQRRHQKVVEEAPCPVMTPELRNAMGQAAVDVARAINYQGAGTVEFLLDADNQFYFLEMNTRLQVEHPVTEMITGLDLVSLQFRVAQGEELGFSQNDVLLNGHAIEVRVYAEDPAQGFLPRTGHIELWQGSTAEGVRIDTGIETGQVIGPYYDPMMAKVIAWGEDRETARFRLIEALKHSCLFGVTTNIAFLIDVLAHPKFADGSATTAFIQQNFSKDELEIRQAGIEQAAIAAVLQYHLERKQAGSMSLGMPDELLNWSSAEPLRSHYRYTLGRKIINLAVSPQDSKALPESYQVLGNEEAITIQVVTVEDVKAIMQINSRFCQFYFYQSETGVISLSLDGHNSEFRNELAFAKAVHSSLGSGAIVAPMHGLVMDVFIATGDKVSRGQRLVVVEAMKMQHEVLADVDGVVELLFATAGKQVAANDLLVRIK